MMEVKPIELIVDRDTSNAKCVICGEPNPTRAIVAGEHINYSCENDIKAAMELVRNTVKTN